MRADNTAVSESGRAGSGGSRRPRKSGAYMLAWVLVVLIGSPAWYYYVGTRKIPSVGGLYFLTRLVLPVQRFAQNDPRWADDQLGPTPSTMGEEGCAVSSAAMLLAFYGQDVDPGRLNSYLSDNGGYTPEGWLYWDKSGRLSPRLGATCL